jgi:hypothetical protein
MKPEAWGCLGRTFKSSKIAKQQSTFWRKRSLNVAAKTTVSQDDHWWKGVFTPAEANALQASFARIVKEHEDAEVASSEPVEILIAIPADEFFSLLKNLAMAQRDGYDVAPFGMAMSMEYFENDSIPNDNEGSENAAQFWSPIWDDEDDEDDDE